MDFRERLPEELLRVVNEFGSRYIDERVEFEAGAILPVITVGDRTCHRR